MSRVLTQEEINVLLASAAQGRVAAERGDESENVSLYNFRRPDRVSKEQLRSLHLLHDRFALNVSTSLSAFLRAMTEVNIISVDQYAYSDFLMSLPDPTAFYAIGLHPLEGLGAIELNPSIAFTMVDRLLGGTGQTPPPSRPLTEIEQNVIDSVMKLLLDNLTETWKAVTSVQFRIHGRETRPQMLQVTGPNEIVILIVFDIRLGETRSTLNLCIPAATIESVEESFAQGWHRTQRQPTPEEEAWLRDNLGRVPLPVTALLETSLPTSELLALKPGDVIALGHSAANPVEVHVGRVRRFAGRLTRDDDGAGVLVESMHGRGLEPEVSR